MKFTKKVLDNGMTIVMIPMKNTKIISVGFFIRAGSRNETNENMGIAHFLEHMMFKGTDNRSAETLFKELDILGSEYNAATTTQHTYYYTYGSSDDLKKILDIMLDIYINPKFEAKEINKEKKVIIEEMRMRGDMPFSKLYSAMHKKIFMGTSLERDIIGTAESVLALKKKDFTDFRKSLYKPDNTVFVIAGNFSPAPIFKILESHLGEMDNHNEHPPTYQDEKAIILNNMEGQSEPYIYIKKNVLYQQVYMLLVFPLYDLYDEHTNEIDLLSKVLTSGFSSRLSKSLREKKGITYRTNSYPIVYADSGVFIIDMVVNPSEFITGLKIILKELKKLKTDLISKEEMTKIVNMTKNEAIYSLSKPLNILTYYGLNFLYDRDFKPNLNKELIDLKKVTREDLRKIAKKIFTRDKINLFIYGNVEETKYDFLKL